MSFALLFPGQGSQSLHMMDALAQHAVVLDTFNTASAILQQDLWAMLHAKNPEMINETVNTQPLMLTAGVATWRVWLSRGGCMPSVAAGHSLGEYSALVAAEALSFADAVKLVRLRAELMQQAVPFGAGAMAAILGLDEAAVAAACKAVAQDEVVEPVNFNSPEQIVIAGDRDAVERAMTECKNAGAKRTLLLPVSVPAHSSLMRPAADLFAQALSRVPIGPPRFNVLHNADVIYYSDERSIRDALVRQLYRPVRWTETIHYCVTNGVTQLAECGPGRVLAGLVKRLAPTVNCWSLIDDVSIDHACAQISLN